jgi:glutamate--cysteine ligase
MRGLQERLKALSAARLQGMGRGVEKESLRVTPAGALARTPHPHALGAALTHPHITTDFSEAQLELITGVHRSAESVEAELTQVHQAVYRALGDEMMWVGSMPCTLPPDEDQIPLGRYGTSNVGMSKTVYRTGLGHRYGRRMQTISGIHYNWSLPDVTTAEYFGLIRNFRRRSFLLLYLFGASPAIPRGFADQAPDLQPMGTDTLYMPHATSLRMGRLGYQSDAQNSLCVSYNSLDSYAASLADALVRPYPAYQKLGIQAEDGSYLQLNDSLLQIENEFYSTIRPKRVIFPGERPLHALRERGVEYIEVRCMDLDPFVPAGIAPATMRMIDIFLLHCLLDDSPLDSPNEIAELGRNQQRVASRGREPGLKLERGGVEVLMADWLREILTECAPIAAWLDATEGTDAHAQALAAARAAVLAPETLPSARVLAQMQSQFGGSHDAFVRAQSQRTRSHMLELDLPADVAAHMAELATESLAEQARIEAADTMPFEIYRQHYLAPERLRLPRGTPVPAA